MCFKYEGSVIKFRRDFDAEERANSDESGRRCRMLRSISVGRDVKGSGTIERENTKNMGLVLCEGGYGHLCKFQK